ncbi:MAG: hypothetical protein MUC50_07670 [Myxococcota bacterium]|jgi:hypothetical protein|nr:hypothetical protein [Myxococcota bacterium]
MRVLQLFRFSVAIALAVLLSCGGVAALPKTIGVDEIKPGMKGYGLTVFSGQVPERFDVEVISVVPQFLLRQDVILIRCKHPVTDNAGVIGGMSGSPIYIEGRLAGALAYGWQFGKDPVAGVTAIADMLDILKRPRRGPRAPSRLLPLAEVMDSVHKRRPVLALRGEDTQETSARSGGLRAVRTPLSMGGFVGAALDLLSHALEPLGIDPVAGGGAGRGKASSVFVEGGALGVQLIRGDMSATGIGTVTVVEGKDVLAFGHPMFNLGEGYFPVTTAQIHTVIASLARSNKLGSPLVEVGSLVQDRSAGIAARTDERSSMIPLTIRLRDDRSKRDETYRAEVASHRMLTPQLLQAALVNVIMYGASDAEDVTADVVGRIRVSGRPEIVLSDSGASRSGLASLSRFFRPVGLVAGLLANPFEDVVVESAQFDVRLGYGLEVAALTGAYLTTSEPSPGEEVGLAVRLRPYGKDEVIYTTKVEIPASAAGQRIQIEIAGGDYQSPVLPLPRSVDDLIANVQRFYPPRSLVVGVTVPGQGISVRGQLLERLPSFAVDALSPLGGVDESDAYQTALRKVLPMPYVIEGSQSVRLNVEGRRSR